ncbi:hypothetical protein GQ457_17G017560 [Hibiscus cannabinus]
MESGDVTGDNNINNQHQAANSSENNRPPSSSLSPASSGKDAVVEPGSSKLSTDGPTTPISPSVPSGRIPSHVFRTSTANRVEWGAASNESLFSINPGNTSFHKEQMNLMSKSGEFGDNCDPLIISSPLMDLPTTRVFTEMDTNGKDCNESATEPTAAEAAPHSRSLSQLSDASAKSFAFPVLTDDGDKTQQSEPCTNPEETKIPVRKPLNQEPLKSQSQKNAVDEFGLNFHPKQSDVPLQSKAKKSVEYSLGSSSDPSSVPDHSTAQTNGSRFNCIEEDEVAKAICLEKGSLVNEFSSEINAMTSLGEKVFLGNLQFEELSPLNNLKTSIPNQISSEAVPIISNVNSVEAFGPSTQLDHQVVRWVDVVTKNLVSQGVRVGEDLTQLHNRNLVLDPCTGQEGCEAPFRRNPTDEEVGLSLSATKGIIEVERTILSDGILPNIINRFCSVQLMPIVAEVC